MSAWKRSKELSDKTWALIKEEPLLAAYPVKGAVYGLGASLVGIVPGVAIIGFINNAAGVVAGLLFVLLGAIVGTTVAMIQLAALVVAADALLRGATVTHAECIAEAKRHTNALAGWSAISVLVGLLLNAAQGDGGGDNIAFAVVRILFAGLLAAAWTLLTFFVLPVIVLEGLGPIKAIKRSAALIKQQWGDAIVGGFRIGIRVAILLIIPGIVLTVGGIFLAVGLDNIAAFIGGGILIVAGIGLLIAGAVLQSAARNVFGVALYHFATGSESLGPFSSSELAGAVRTK